MVNLVDTWVGPPGRVRPMMTGGEQTRRGPVQVGVDVGGTFTDAVATDGLPEGRLPRADEISPDGG